ncbi:hypothetical protein DOTSEDRAFT_73833 [Dothistroma septosporum NZE10]|uniref:DUF1765-domain-containing protein n=1 Tax=Dothistroma septosporum (strain NZE10 / CBS 128990) TaxID=675120 RepID=N1PJQ0_DOTSN|nr:hypothetical protein DOTSEDRAFT_73833 [Dothistroma septosporum NZE10]
MATVATERMNGHATQPQPQYHGAFERGRRGSRKESNGHATAQHRVNEELPRAASYTLLPAVKDRQYANSDVVEIKAFPLPEHPLKDDDEDTSQSDTSLPDSSRLSTPDEHVPSVPPPQAHEIDAKLQKSPSASKRSSIESSIRQSCTSLESARTVSTTATTPGSTRHRPSVISNKSFSRRFSKHSFQISAPSTPSRSPSPAKQEIAAAAGSIVTIAEEATTTDGRRKSLLSRTLTSKSGKGSKDRKPSPQSGDEDDTEPSVKRRSTFLRKKSSRSRLSKVASYDVRALALAENAAPAMPALPKSFSTDKLPNLRSSSPMSDRAAPLPRLVSSEKVHQPSPLSGVTRKKDELWSVFRTLEGDFTKFSSKTTSLKANVVRNSLMSFLRSYPDHPSNKTLRPEDLDRRVNILNKWWTGLVELLHGRNNQSISGTDRPAILDGIIGIMERPEWRLAPSPFCPLAERIRVTLSTGNRSSTSFRSVSSDFVSESVYHNVRNIFVQNLSSQMVFVVDKMSMRNASASLVAFCGKACAYAFMFVPGMADVLVRLWELPVDTLRRVLSENGIGKFDQVTEFAADILANFPPALQQLGFTSLMKYMRKLRTSPPLPLGTSHVEWWGTWLNRWNGKESDLFYVFAKHYHILATEFLPSDSTKKERMCAPGMLLVHAQILASLDATIHREAAQNQHDLTAMPAPTFDEMLGDPDAVATTLPLPPTNAVRLMAENRLVMLIRDFLSERTGEHPLARELFAQSFNDLLQASARATSLFDHSACYVLLDFMEEALVILIRYEQLRLTEGPLLNQDFWQTVCRKMIESDNTMTEVRLYAFLFTVWNIFGKEWDRRTNLCLSLLLEPDVFESRFNHWCPMVRAYFMRLLCWRLGRHDGDDGDSDLPMLETLQQRLQDTWSHYLHLRDTAERDQSLPPVTSPCNPAPGRRLLIVRTDNQATTGGSFLTFEGLLRDASMQKPAWRRTSEAAALLDGADPRPDSSSSNGLDSDTEAPKGIGGFFRKMMSTKARSKSKEPPKEPTESKNASSASGKPLAIIRAATDDPSVSEQANTTGETSKPASQSQYRTLSFKFSLEFHPANKPMPPMRLFPPRLPPPAQQYLQSHSNKRYSVEGAMRAVEPRGESASRARYSGRALAEWTMVVGECHNFFERRKNEGAPSNKHVETPALGVEVFKRPP